MSIEKLPASLTANESPRASATTRLINLFPGVFAPLFPRIAQVADAVVRGLHRGASRVWVPGRLRPVFFVMRLLPQAIWRRMPR
jgi:hypothetical protein